MEDSHCVAAWYMNGTDAETDRSGSGETLSETNTVEQDEATPIGYSADNYSRSFSAVSDNLYHANGGTCDLSDADGATTSFTLIPRAL